LAARGRISPEAGERASILCRGAIAALVPPQARVAGYLPFRGELDVRPAMQALADKGHILCLPVIEEADKPLYFRRWRLDEALEDGRYGIAVPPAGALVFRPDVVIVPLVAFDRKGRRLGYGAGYYDRTIDRLRQLEPSVLVIGVAYSQQEVEALPVGRHDQAMDVIVTEKETLRVKK